jgi:hypothetical protein
MTLEQERVDRITAALARFSHGDECRVCVELRKELDEALLHARVGGNGK